MTQPNDAERLALIESAKSSFRRAQATRTWEQRVAAIARMNQANAIARDARAGAAPAGTTTLRRK
jgi:hypothetical protein